MEAEEHEHLYMIRRVELPNGKQRVEFECPHCQQWNEIVKQSKINVLSFACHDCMYEENLSIDDSDGDLH